MKPWETAQRMRQRRLFLRRALNNHWEHDRATWQRDMVFTGVNVTHRVVLKRNVVERSDCGTSETWLEQCFRATEAFAANTEEVSFLG